MRLAWSILLEISRSAVEYLYVRMTDQYVLPRDN
jgi:hypothetical protein